MRGIKTTIILLLVALLLFSSCNMIPGSENRGCNEGDNCMYYQGTDGVEVFRENMPRMLYYKSEDRFEENGNEVEFDVRVENHGASDAAGAVFLTGLSPDLFVLTRIDDEGEKGFLTSNIQDACYFDLGFDEGISLSNVLGYMSCGGLTGSSNQRGWTAGIDGDMLSKTLSAFGWKDQPEIMKYIKPLNVEVGRDYTNGWNFGVDVDSQFFNVMINGKPLAILVSGLDFERWNGLEYHLRGDNPNSPGGDIDYKSFRAQLLGDWPAGQDYFDLPYQIKNCYGYTTFISTPVCIDGDPYSNEDKVCRAETMYFGGSQGAPVAVVDMEQLNTGKELIIDMTIKNLGGGEVWDVGKLEACSPYFPGTIKNSYKNIVYVGPALIDNDPKVECTPRRLRLDPNTQEAKMTCRFDIEGKADVGSGYVGALKMELWYGYEDTIRDQLTVRRVS